MKKNQKFLILTILIIVFIYLLFSFANADFNFTIWSESARACCSVCFATAPLFAAIVYIEN